MNPSQNKQQQGAPKKPGPPQQPKKARQRQRRSGQAQGPNQIAPVAVARQLTNVGPTITRNSSGDLIVEHTELLESDVTASPPFEILEYVINPGLFAQFHWLWPIASRFETYKFESFDVTYQPACGTDQTGTVCMGFEFNMNDFNPQSMAELYSYQGSARCVPWMAATAYAPKRGLDHRTQFYTRTSGVEGRTVIAPGIFSELYDTCRLLVAREGQSGTDKIGELYIHYRVKFMTPQMSSRDGTLNNTQFYRYLTNTDPGTLAGQGNWGRNPVVTGANWSQVWIANQPFNGVVMVSISGVGIGTVNATGSTATFSNIDTTTEGSTGIAIVYSVVADIDETFQLNVVNTSLSNLVVTFAAQSF